MKQFLLLLIALCMLLNNGNSQNLVPNPSFEEYTQCPDDQCQIMRATGWMSFGYTPDYCNACASTSYSVPQNVFGFQHAATGSAYAHLGFYSALNNIREYIGIQLEEQLEIGEKYFYSMKVCLTIRTNGSNVGVNKLGALLSTVTYDLGPESCNSIPSGLNPPKNFAHVYTDSIITDTTNWTTISGTFIADSAYRYLVIGNFFDNANTQYIVLGDTIVTVKISGYYVDDVILSRDTSNYIHESILEKIRIYPNPATETITILTTHFEDKSFICLINLHGQVQKNVEIKSQEITISLADLPAGLYYILIQCDGIIFRDKIVIIH